SIPATTLAPSPSATAASKTFLMGGECCLPFWFHCGYGVACSSAGKIAGRRQRALLSNSVPIVAEAFLRRTEAAQRSQGCDRLCGNRVATNSGSIHSSV